MPLNSALRRNDGWVEVRFDFDRKIIDAVRKIPGRSWINDRKVWEFPGDENTLNALQSVFGKRITVLLKSSKRAEEFCQTSFLDN